MMLEVRSVESPLVLKEGFQVLLAGEGMGMEPVLEAVSWDTRLEVVWLRAAAVEEMAGGLGWPKAAADGWVG